MVALAGFFLSKYLQVVGVFFITEFLHMKLVTRISAGALRGNSVDRPPHRIDMP